MKAILKAGMVSIALVLLVVVAAPAQQSGGMHGAKMAPDSKQNMMMMSGMMQHMQHMMGKGGMSPEHQQQMAEVMGKMSGIMKEMHGPNAMKLQPQHHKQLEDLDKQLKSIPE
jgi:tartrate dehydratase beta subunit/fumarate hydratase class I family protein